MSKSLTFGSTIVTIPTTSDAADWSQGVTLAFDAISLTLQNVTGLYDVPSQSVTLDSYNPTSGTTSVAIIPLSFPTTKVRSIDVDYAVSRSSSAASGYQKGKIEAIYNGSTWELGGEHIGNASVSFTINSSGNMYIVISGIGGTSHTGQLVFSAKAFLQTY